MMNEPVLPFDIHSTLLTLDEQGGVTLLPVNETFWQDLGAGKFGDFAGGRRLVSYSSMDQDWPTWEMHPAGEEFVCLLSGTADFVLQQDGAEKVVRLDKPGSYVIVPRGVWHTARISKTCSMLFITPGEGTENRSEPPKLGAQTSLRGFLKGIDTSVPREKDRT